MNLMQQVQLATLSYLKLAYPGGTPKRIEKKVEELQEIDSKLGLLQWSGLEREENRYNFRLGNEQYQHMKLVFILEEGRPVFYVDAHDDHFKISPSVPGYEKLLAIREANRKLKKAIETAWVGEKLSIFGRQVVVPNQKKICCGTKVLVVDDEDQILDMLTLIVTSVGGQIMRAHSAEEGRKVIRQQGTPHLILCDIMMPGESGYEFVSWLKQEQVDAPVYFITGLTLEKVKKNGVCDVLQKPFSAKDIMGLMRRCK